MLTANNKDAQVSFSYDLAGRLLSETLNGKTTAYSYDIPKGIRSYIYPSGTKVEEHLNARDLIASIIQNGSEVVTMAYNTAGQKTTQTYANGISTNYEYNENGWLSRIVDNAQILDLAMAYDAIGNITQRKDGIDPTQTEDYGYDAISQLISFKRGTSVDKTYQFDLLGNRVKTVENGVITNFTTNKVNAYTSIAGGMTFTPEYDGNGNLLNDDKHTFVYDLNNRMVSADNNAVTFKYDALGRRIAKNDITYFYIGDQMIEEYEKDNFSSFYLYGNNIDEVLQMSRGDMAYNYHRNHLESTLALSDDDGKLIERVAYEAYGSPQIISAEGLELTKSSVKNNILFTGREFDCELINYYFRTRNQHPYIGQFMQHDPLMYIDGMNDRTYVVNNAVNYVDPFGNSGINPDWFKVNPSKTRNNINDLDRSIRQRAKDAASIFCKLEEGMREKMDELKKSTQDFNDNNIDFWKDLYKDKNDPYSNYMNDWLDDVSAMNYDHPYLTVGMQAGMGIAHTWGAYAGWRLLVRNPNASRAAGGNVIRANFGKSGSNVIRANFAKNLPKAVNW